MEFLEHHELAHFAVEEAVLLPMIPTHAPGPTLARQMLLDHAFFRDAVQRLRASGAPPDAELLRGIGQRLRDHVQMEERQLFPCLERSLSASELEEVSSRVEASPARRR